MKKQKFLVENPKASFKRSFTLGESLNGDNIKASFKNDVLNIDIPKV